MRIFVFIVLFFASLHSNAYIIRAKNCDSLKNQIDAARAIDKSDLSKTDNILLKDLKGFELDLAKREVEIASSVVAPCYYKNTDYRYTMRMMGDIMSAVNCSTEKSKTTAQSSTTVLFITQEGKTKEGQVKKLIPRRINVMILNGKFSVNGQICHDIALNPEFKY